MPDDRSVKPEGSSFSPAPYVARKNSDRARQFMPFAALRGYYDLIRERERKRELQPRRELTEEEALVLSQKFAQVKRRSMVSVTYYDGEAYVTVKGLVSDIDEAARAITVVRTRIFFDDIVDINDA